MAAVLADPALNITTATAPATPWAADRQPLIDAVRAIATGELAAMADAIDRQGTYPRAVLQQLGAAGAFRAHLLALLTDR